MRSSERERESRKVTSYLPDNSLRNGYLSLLKDIVLEIISTRWLTYQLFRRDLFSFYKQSLLGAFWVVFVPLVTVGTFIVLKGSGVVAVGTVQAPYPVYAAIGIGIWQLFSQGLVAGANSLVAGGEMITRINFSKKSLVIASMGRTLVSFAVVVVLFLGLLLYYAGHGWALPLRPTLLLVPLTLLPMLLITLGLSFYLALINGVVRDVGTMLSMLLTFLMLLTPVLYERPKIAANAGEMARFLDTVTEYNPLHYLVAGPRELMLDGSIAEPRAFLISSAVSLVLFLVSVVGFHLTETRIAERI